MRFTFIVVVNFVIIFELTGGQISDDLVVSLNEPRSKIRGHVLKSSLGKDYYGFQDIPYAVPPVGELRFAEPVPHSGWKGILNTTANEKICMENNVYGTSGTEDCLVINVYTPVKNSSAKLPVFFFILGGAFQRGTAQYQKYNPQHFADHDIIIVTFNYRVGPLGFLTTQDGIIPGNVGLKDQALALRWVNWNIEVFGGDPQKVTIAGQSAGSISVSYHILSQKSTGLYRAGIMSSGTALTHGSFIEHAKNYSFQLGQLLDNDFISSDSTELLKLLREASAQDLLAASLKVQRVEKDIGIEQDLTWAPVIEDKNYKNALITQSMHLSLVHGHYDKVPILLGFTSEEIVTRIQSVESLKDTAAQADKNPANLIHAKWHITERNRIVAGKKMKRLYTSRSFSDNLPAFIAYSSDIFLVNGVIRTADLVSKSVPVYMFQLSDEVSLAHHVDIPGVNGVGHSEDLYYMWYDIDLNAAELLTSNRLVTMWANFVKNLNPTPTANQSLGLPIWPRLEQKKLVYIDIGSNVTVKINPKNYFGVKAIFRQYMKPPYNVY